MTFIKTGILARQHDLTHSPVGLWQFDGNLLDSSGNGFTLTLENGTERYTRLPGGRIQGAMFDGSTNFIYNVSEATLRLLGDMTVECLVEWFTTYPGQGGNSNVRIADHGQGSGESEADNHLYSFGPSTVMGMRYFAETGVGVNVLFDTVESAPMDLQHLAMTRVGGAIEYWVNGESIAQSGALSSPTGGANGRFRAGGTAADTAQMIGMVASLKLVDAALTAQQIADEYGRTLG